VFLINPFGLQYHEVTASNLVAIDLEGNPVRPGQHPINRAGFVVHGAIHGHVEDAHCVMHTHTTTGCAVSCLEEGLSHDSFYGALLHGRLAYHDFEGVTVDPDEQQRLVRSIGDKKAVILRNHGLLSWGGSIQEAFLWLWTLQRACDVQIAAASAGQIRRLEPAVLAQASREPAASQRIVYDMVYAALKRKLDAIDQAYKN
jgi:ribulose-5-phosphate 4-epimerase/fuculose-1-phosphate aldolase